MASAKGKAYYVIHQISTHMPGSVIHFTENHLKSASDGGTGVSTERLLGLGAMREATDKEAKDSVEYGTGDAVAGLIPFPSVPFDPTLPEAAIPDTSGTSNIKELGLAEPGSTGPATTAATTKK